MRKLLIIFVAIILLTSCSAHDVLIKSNFANEETSDESNDLNIASVESIKAADEEYEELKKMYDEGEYSKVYSRTNVILIKEQPEHHRIDDIKKLNNDSLYIVNQLSLQSAKDYFTDENYSQAVASLDSILLRVPNHVEALGLHEEYSIKLKEQQQKEAEEKEALKKVEAEEKEALRKAEAKKRGVSLGMTQDQVLESNWGEPESINRTTYTFGVYEQWCYPGYNYLYFEDGILTTVQN